MQITTNTSLSKAFTIIKSAINSLTTLVNAKPNINDSTPSTTTVYSSNKVDNYISEVKSIYKEVNLAVSSFTQNSDSSDWARAYYADITVEGSNSNMLADITPDTKVTSVKDVGLLTLTDTMPDNIIRLYFSAQPTGTYQIKVVTLTPCKPNE